MSKNLRKIALGLMVLPFLAVTVVQASSSGGGARVPDFAIAADPGLPVIVPQADVARGSSGQYAPIQMAQASDPRVSQLEEQIRQLTGKIEELNFQILQMQEQMRKVQEDNEFRFEELEKNKRSDAGGKQDRTVAEAPSTSTTQEASQDASSTADAGTSVAPAADPNAAGADAVAVDPQIIDPNAATTGMPPQTLGTIRFDANGNVIGETQVDPGSQSSLPTSSDGQVIAALPQTNDPKELYQEAYQLLLSGDYRASEAAFRSHIDRFPNDEASPDARFWLGESLYGQGRYQEAASVFLDAHRDFPESRKSAENLLKLGMTMAKMNDREVACATLASVPKRYPNASVATLDRVKHERASNKC